MMQAGSDMDGRWDRGELRKRVSRSHRGLRELLSRLAVLEGELEACLNEARERRSELEAQVQRLLSWWERVVDQPDEDPDAIPGAEAIGVSLETEMVVQELERMIKSRDQWKRRVCPVCKRAYLASTSKRAKRYCSGRCRSHYHRKKSEGRKVGGD